MARLVGATRELEAEGTLRGWLARLAAAGGMPAAARLGALLDAVRLARPRSLSVSLEGRPTAVLALAGAHTDSARSCRH
jgi:hypothetical protein